MTPFSVLPVIPPRFELGSDKAATPTALRICCCQHFKQTCFDLLHTRAYTLGRVRTCEALWRKILSLNVISELLCVDKWRIRTPWHLIYGYLLNRLYLVCVVLIRPTNFVAWVGFEPTRGNYAQRILSPSPSTWLGASCYVLLETAVITYIGPSHILRCAATGVEPASRA